MKKSFPVFFFFLFSVAVQAQPPGDLVAYSHSLAERIHREHRYAGSVETPLLPSLPIGLTGQLNHHIYLLLWDSLRFTPQGAFCDLYVHLYRPEQSQPLVFARKRCPLLPGDSLIQLPLVSDVLSDQAFVEVNRQGLQRLHLPDSLLKTSIAGWPTPVTRTKRAHVLLPAPPLRLQANFLVASFCSTGDTVQLSEVSLPIPDSVQWQYPLGTQVVKDGEGVTPQVMFPKSGRYPLTLTAYYGSQAYHTTKTIVVKGASGGNLSTRIAPVSVIDTVSLYPNPNKGQFRVHVKLKQPQAVVLRVIEATSGREMLRRYYPRVTAVKEDLFFPTIRPGSYVLKVVTATDNQERLFTVVP